MATYTVDDTILLSEAAERYFADADSRVMVGVRCALEMLGIPVPPGARRKPPGRPPSRRIAAACDADHKPVRKLRDYQPRALTEAQMQTALRKMNERIARRQAASGGAPQNPASLFDQTFSD